MTDEQSPLFAISTAVTPAVPFDVDGVLYRIKSAEHMSEEDEARINVLFSRHARLARRLDDEQDENKATKIAVALRKNRIALLCTLTDLPEDVAERLPMSGQVKLLDYIRKEVTGDSDDLGDTEGDADADI